MQPKPLQSRLQTSLSIMSVKFSPFNPDQIAVACADNFGIAGKGSIIVGRITPGRIEPLAQFTEHDAIFDCSWSEASPNLLVSGCGDGEVKLWDLQSQKLLFAFHESKDEVMNVEFSHLTPQLLLSSSMLGLTRLYDFQAQKVIQSFKTHNGCTQTSTWHPVQPSMFATCGVDGALRLWDRNAPMKNVASVKAHQSDTMGCDFNKHEEQIATCSADKTISIWDLRQLKAPINVLLGHRHPVRRVKYSPHDGKILGSVSYDMTCRVWNTLELQQPQLKMHSFNTEFVSGLDFSNHTEGQIATGSWDGSATVWQWNQDFQIGM